MFMPVESVWNAGAADLPLLDLRLFPVSCPRCKIKKEQNQINCLNLSRMIFAALIVHGFVC
jgi:hypothetical protein